MTIDEVIEKGYTYEEIKEQLNPRRAAKEKRLLSKDKLTKDECDWLIRNGTKIPRDKKPKGYAYTPDTRFTRGDEREKVVVSEDVAYDMYKDFINGMEQADISKKYDLTRNQVFYYISLVKKEKPELYEEKLKKEREQEKKQNKKILRLHKLGYSKSEISRKTGRSRTYVRKVINRSTS
jgi:hypothetical protein